MDADDEANLGNIGDKIGDLEVGTVFGVYKDGEGNYRNYDSYSSSEKAKIPYVLYSLRSTSLDNLSNKLGSIKIGEVMQPEEGSVLSYASECSVSDPDGIVDAIKNNAKLSQLIDVNESSPKILKTLTDFDHMDGETPVYGDDGVKITNLQTKLNTLLLKDVIDIGATPSTILKTLQNCYVFGTGPGSLTDKLDNLKISEVFDDIYETDPLKADALTETYHDGFIYKNTDTEFEHKKIKTTWWFLFTEDGESFTADEKYYVLKNGADYTINDMNQLVSNMTYHVQTETLYDLQDAGFLTCSRATLDKQVYTSYTGFTPDPESKRAMGTLTIDELIAAIAQMPSA